MYIKAVDKILRFRLFREQLLFKLESQNKEEKEKTSKSEAKENRLQSNLAFVNFKLGQYVHRDNLGKLWKQFEHLKEKVEKSGPMSKENAFLQGYLEMWN